jgi:hypothetical protein
LPSLKAMSKLPKLKEQTYKRNWLVYVIKITTFFVSEELTNFLIEFTDGGTPDGNVELN